MIKNEAFLTSSHLSSNILSFSAKMIIAVFGFFIFFVVIRSYPQDIYAEWIFYMTILMLIENLRGGLIRNALIKLLAGVEDIREQRQITGSAWVINILTVVVVFLVFYIAYILTEIVGLKTNYSITFIYVPIFLLAYSAITITEALLQIKNRYGILLLLTTINYGGLLLFCILNYAIFRLPMIAVVLVQITLAALISVITILTKSAGLTDFFQADIKHIKSMLHFGKYCMGTTLGGNLLKNAGMIIIGMLMTKIDVALYSVPLRLLDAFQAPVESFSNVAFPFLSKAGNRNDLNEVKELFYRYTGVLTLLFIPVLALLFFTASTLIFIFSGRQYLETNTTTSVFRLFVIYGLFLPTDRFIGNTLDSLGLPKYNFFKVIIMLVVNVAGDVAAIVLFHSLELVASVTILTSMCGLVTGYMYLGSRIRIRFHKIPLYGISSLKANMNLLLLNFFNSRKY
jgi:O-antigen/teichoic acid export membrane protein